MKCEGKMTLLLPETGALRNSGCGALKTQLFQSGNHRSFPASRFRERDPAAHKSTVEPEKKVQTAPSSLFCCLREPLQCDHSPSASRPPPGARPWWECPAFAPDGGKPGQWRKFPASAAVRMNDSNVCLFSHLTHCPLPSALTFSQDTLLIF